MKAICRLNHLGLLQVDGPDAATFLHGQLSNDVLHMDGQSARLAAYCSPQGKMLASFLVCKPEDHTFWLLGCADLLDTITKRLSMFILRAKLQITNISTKWPLYGLSYTDEATTEDLPAWQVIVTPSSLEIELPAATPVKQRIVAYANTHELPEWPKSSIEHWQWLTLQSGITLVNAATADRYIPQMFNYESVGGINFKKGCYPGQEVISRSQFRGTLKRKLFKLHSSNKLEIGASITQADNPQMPCGEIVMAGAAPNGGWDALAVLRTENAVNTPLSVSGAPLLIEPLPYPIQEVF